MEKGTPVVALLVVGGLIGLDCYGTVHGATKHESGWVRLLLIPPAALYYGAEGLLWHEDEDQPRRAQRQPRPRGADGLLSHEEEDDQAIASCRRARECRIIATEKEETKCVADGRAMLSEAAPARRRAIEAVWAMAASMSCPELREAFARGTAETLVGPERGQRKR